MKKICLFLLSYIFIFALSVPVFATSNNVDTVSSDGIQYFKVVSGNGVYLFGGEPKAFDIDEFRRKRKAQKTDYISEEQIAEGYILWDGWLYPPNDVSDSDMGAYVRGEGDIDLDYYTGMVKFTIDVPPATTCGVYIEVMDAVTYDTYRFEFYPAEHFRKDISMYPGTYLITDGGFLDASIRGVASESYFRVLRNDVTSVKIAVRDYEAIIRNGKDDIDDAVHEMDDAYVQSLQKEELNKYGIESDLFNTDGLNEKIADVKQNGISGLFGSVSSNEVEEEPSGDHHLIFAIVGIVFLLILIGTVLYGVKIYIKNQEDG